MKRSIGKRCHDEDDMLENDAEQMRLFYVGLTRAKKSLFIPVPSPESTISQTKQASMIEHYVNHYHNGLIGFGIRFISLIILLLAVNLNLLR